MRRPSGVRSDPIEMSEDQDTDQVRRQLLEELTRLDAEQRTLDLRDGAALARVQEKIRSLRERISRLKVRRRTGT